MKEKSFVFSSYIFVLNLKKKTLKIINKPLPTDLYLLKKVYIKCLQCLVHT